MTPSEFKHLKQQVIINVANSNCHIYILKKMKEFYRDDIDSERRFEKINNIGEILDILQMRNVITDDNVGPMKEIARMLNDNELLQNICDYENNHVPRENVNYYAIKNTENVLKREPEAKITHQNLFEDLSEKKKKRIKETLVEEIGMYWRDLARNLKIRECKIDDIDFKYTTLAEKGEELFRIFRETTDSQKWFFILCDALDRSRRKDLRISLQDIITMND